MRRRLGPRSRLRRISRLRRRRWRHRAKSVRRTRFVLHRLVYCTCLTASQGADSGSSGEESIIEVSGPEDDDLETGRRADKSTWAITNFTCTPSAKKSKAVWKWLCKYCKYVPPFDNAVRILTTYYEGLYVLRLDQASRSRSSMRVRRRSLSIAVTLYRISIVTVRTCLMRRRSRFGRRSAMGSRRRPHPHVVALLLVVGSWSRSMSKAWHTPHIK